MKKKTTRDALLEDLHHHLHNLVNKHKTLDRLPRNFGIDEMLIGSEVHTIGVIGDCSVTTVSQVGCMLGISKAAASQAVRKLHKNGYIRKLKDENSKREVYLSLTEKGRKAYEGHRNLWGRNCADYLSDLTEEQIENFIEVAEKIILTVDAQLDDKPQLSVQDDIKIS